MPRVLSAGATNALMAQTTDEAFIILVTFTSPQTAEVFRCCLNTEDIVSLGNTFTATYFDISLPETTDKAPSGCEITVDNVDQRLVGMLRQVTIPLQVMVQVVLASTPNIIEMEFTDLVLREVTWDQYKIQGRLVSEDPLNQTFPGHIYEPRTFQGIF